MKKIIKSCIIMLSLLFIVFEILYSSKSVLNSVKFSFSIWTNNIFPSLFPFFVISGILVNYGFIELISEMFKPLMTRIFKIPDACAYIFFMSIISGFPSNAKYTKELLDKEMIDKNDASKILLFTHFSNPLFILGTLSIYYLKNKSVGMLILISHYLTNIIIGLFFRNYHSKKIKYEKTSLKKAIIKMHKKRISNNNSFGTILTNSLKNTTDTLLLILGIVTVFLIITNLISNIFNLNPLYQSILSGVFEMTQGLKYVSLLDVSLKFKAVLSVAFISFGGLSVHMQVVSILSDKNIPYLPYLFSRIIHSIISSLLVFIFYDLFI